MDGKISSGLLLTIGYGLLSIDTVGQNMARVDCRRATFLVGKLNKHKTNQVLFLLLLLLLLLLLQLDMTSIIHVPQNGLQWFTLASYPVLCLIALFGYWHNQRYFFFLAVLQLVMRFLFLLIASSPDSLLTDVPSILWGAMGFWAISEWLHEYCVKVRYFYFFVLSSFLSFFLSLSLSCSFFSLIFFSLFFLISRSPHFRNWFLLIVFFVVFEAVVDIILNYFIESHLDSDQRGDLVDLRLALVFGLLFLVLSCSFVIISYAIFPFILTVFRDENTVQTKGFVVLYSIIVLSMCTFIRSLWNFLSIDPNFLINVSQTDDGLLVEVCQTFLFIYFCHQIVNSFSFYKQTKKYKGSDSIALFIFD